MVVDGDVVTSAGGLTGYEGSLCVVGQLFGQAEADKIGLGVWSEQQECGRFAVKAPFHSDSSEHTAVSTRTRLPTAGLTFIGQGTMQSSIVRLGVCRGNL